MPARRPNPAAVALRRGLLLSALESGREALKIADRYRDQLDGVDRGALRMMIETLAGIEQRMWERKEGH